MPNGFQKILDRLDLSACAALSDEQLLGTFLAAQDEASFTAMVRRHGPMVLGVCRRVLRHDQDAEDAFQATFLVLARKASTVMRRQSLACWLYQVAYRMALEAAGIRAARRTRERPMKEMPQPQTTPAEVQDWRALLDRAISDLPDKYRACVVLCDLEGLSRKEAALQLGIPEGTLSSRLATAHKKLAKRLAGSGLALTGGVLSVVPGNVSAALAHSTAKAALLVAAGQLAAVSTPAAVLMKGMLQTMLLRKLKMVLGTVLVLVTLGVGHVAYWGSASPLSAQTGLSGAPPAKKPTTELERLRKENELLKLNLEVVLEKVRAQEAELQTHRKQAGPTPKINRLPGAGAGADSGGGGAGFGGFGTPGAPPPPPTPPGPTRPSGINSLLRDADNAMKGILNSRDPKEKEQAARKLDDIIQKLRELLR